jgi:hypothetical protein
MGGPQWDTSGKLKVGKDTGDGFPVTHIKATRVGTEDTLELYANDTLVFKTSSNIDSERMRIDENGEVTTPNTAIADITDSKQLTTKEYVDSQIGDLGSKTVTTESTGIAATDNDTSIPTCAAVNDAIAGNTLKVAIYEKASGSTYGSIVIPITETSDPDNIGSVSSGTVTLGSGVYLVSYTGEFEEDDNRGDEYYEVEIRHNGTALTSDKVDETGNNVYRRLGFATVVSSASSQTVDIYLNENPNTYIEYRNVKLTIVKLA